MPNPKIRILPADLNNAAHATALVDLLDQYARDPMGGGEALAQSTRDNLARVLASRNDAHILLARVDGHWAGLCNCFEGFSTFACQPLLNIHDVYVGESYRGMGIAGKMLQHAEQLALQLGCCKLTLEVLSENHPARRSYLAFGFEPYQLQPGRGHAEFWHKKLDADQTQS